MKIQLLLTTISLAFSTSSALAQDTIITRKNTTLTGEIEDVQLTRILFKSKDHGNSRVKISRLRVKDYSWNSKDRYPQYKGIKPVKPLFHKGAFGLQAFTPGIGASIGFYNSKKNIIWEQTVQVSQLIANGYDEGYSKSFVAPYNAGYENYQYSDYFLSPSFETTFKSGIKYFLGQNYRYVRPYFSAGISTGLAQDVQTYFNYIYVANTDTYDFNLRKSLHSTFYLGMYSGIGVNVSVSKCLSFSVGAELLGYTQRHHTQQTYISRKDGSTRFSPSRKIWEGNYWFYLPVGVYFNF